MGLLEHAERLRDGLRRRGRPEDRRAEDVWQAQRRQPHPRGGRLGGVCGGWWLRSTHSRETTTLDLDAREGILVRSTFYFNSRKRNFVEETGESYETGPTTIYSVPSSGGAKTLVVSMPEANGGLSGMREEGGFLYFVRGSKVPAIVRVPSKGDALEELAAHAQLRTLVGVEGGAVYYTCYSTSDASIRIMRVDLASHESKEIGNPVITGSGIVDVLMDKAFYWVDPNLGVRTMPLAGGVPVTIFQKVQGNSGGVGNLAQNTRALYWTVDESSTAIFQLAK